MPSLFPCERCERCAAAYLGPDSHWGQVFILILFVGGTGYLLVGAGFRRQSGARGALLVRHAARFTRLFRLFRPFLCRRFLVSSCTPHERGRLQLPQPTFWLDIAGLVKDGWAFAQVRRHPATLEGATHSADRLPPPRLQARVQGRPVSAGRAGRAQLVVHGAASGARERAGSESTAREKKEKKERKEKKEKKKERKEDKILTGQVSSAPAAATADGGGEDGGGSGGKSAPSGGGGRWVHVPT